MPIYSAVLYDQEEMYEKLKLEGVDLNSRDILFHNIKL